MKTKTETTTKPSKIGTDERGLSTVEYIILLVLIAVAGIGLWQAFGDTVSEKIASSTEAVSGMGQ